MHFSTTVLLVLLAHALSPTQASATVALRTPSPPKLSRIKCEIAYHTPAWLDSFDDYSPIWLEAATTIRVLQREHEEISKELTSHRKIQHAAKLKFTIRKLQRKNDALYQLIEALAPTPGHLHYNKRKQLEWYYFNILKRNCEPLKILGETLWVTNDQF
jgi:hypothetical protein